MLEQVKRDSPVGIQGDDFTVNKGAGRKTFTGAGDGIET